MAMYQRFSDKMAYIQGKFVDLPSHSRFVSLRLTLMEVRENLKTISQKLSLKTAKAVSVILGNPMNNFCTEYNVDGEGVYHCSFSLKDFKRVRNYSRRKYFAVAVASVTVIALMFSFIFPGQPIGRAASYFWTQTGWETGPDSPPPYPKHTANQSGWAKYSSKDANVLTGYSADGGTAGQAELKAQTDSYTETSDADFNAGSQSQTYVLGTGSGAGVNLALPPGTLTGLTALLGNAQVSLSWTAPSANGSAILHYHVYCGTSSNPTSLCGIGSPSGDNVATTSFTHTGLINNTAYYYKVSAVNAIGEGGLSGEVNATPQDIIVIGAQTWMRYNMNVGTLVANSDNQGTSCSSIQKYCYANIESSCTTYGGLYQWNQAMCGVTTEGAQGICPSGFHIPTNTEFKTLVESLATAGCETSMSWQCSPAGTSLKQNGSSGFNSPMGGFRGTDGLFQNWISYADIWTSTQNGTLAWYRALRDAVSTVYRNNNYDKNAGFSIRCIRN